MGKPDRQAAPKATTPLKQAVDFTADQPEVSWQQRLLLVLFWGYVLLPLAWGVSATVQKALLLFN